ncbi:hypothetical protein TNCV_2784251 [Trichonephila clavipes]|nr:hypothetical protein TNCV_2784251 [Trichonephila clavipes]
MNYSVWSILESKAYTKPHKTLDSLKQSLLREWGVLKLNRLKTPASKLSCKIPPEKITLISALLRLEGKQTYVTIRLSVSSHEPHDAETRQRHQKIGNDPRNPF